MLETNIHPTAIISPKATLEEGVKIGPYSLVGEDVHIGRGTVIGPHVQIEKWTTIGEECKIFFGATIGNESKDLKYEGLAELRENRESQYTTRIRLHLQVIF